MSWDIDSRALPPVPRIPSAANPSRIAPRGSLAPYSPEADRVLSGLHDLLDGARTAVQALADGRPGGRAWEAAETELIRSGKTADFAKFMAAEPTRYAAALLAARTVVARLDDARRAGQPELSEAAAALRSRLHELNEELGQQAEVAWTRRTVGAGAVALEECDRILTEMSRLSALVTWCSGVDREFQHQGRGLLVLDPEANAKIVCARIVRKGNVPMELPATVTGHLPPGFEAWVRDVESRHVVRA